MSDSLLVKSRRERVEALAPAFESNLFDRSPESVFWLGKVASVGRIIDPELHGRVAELRANVYIDEKNFLTEEARLEDGTERDEFDEVSEQFGLFENLGNGSIRAIACGRMILKLSNNVELPIEQYFPELFEQSAPAVGSKEISRFIARHHHKMTQHAASLAIIRAMVYESDSISREDNYCIIEKPLHQMLSGIGLPVEQLGREKSVPEQNGVLHPVSINASKILDTVNDKNTANTYPILSMFFANEAKNAGVGFYPDSLMREVN